MSDHNETAETAEPAAADIEPSVEATPPPDPVKRRVARQMIAGAVALVVIAAAVVAVNVWNDDADSIVAVSGGSNDGAQVGEHFHAFFGLSFCGGPAAPAPPSLPGLGVFSDGQGIAHLAPAGPESAGANASLNRLLEPFGLALTPEGLFNVTEGVIAVANGDPCPEGTPLVGQPAELALSVNGSIVAGDPGGYVPADGDVIFVFLSPAGEYPTGADLLPVDPATGLPINPLALLGAVTEPPGYTPELVSAQARCLNATAPAPPTEAPAPFPAAPDLTIDADTTYTATITTSCGDVVIELDAASAPNTVNSFVFLAREGYFDGTPIHRIVPGFVVQAGDPTGTGMGGPGYSIPDENLNATFSVGTLAMANSGPGTSGSQFFIVSSPEGAASLQPLYSIFGQVTDGLEIVAALDSLGVEDPTGQGTGAPAAPVSVLKVTITER